jgi:hypothetical protein
MASVADYAAGPWLQKLSKGGFEAFYRDFVRRDDVRETHPGAGDVVGPFEV